MKLFLSFVFIFNLSFIYAQDDYIPFVVEDKHWIYQSCGTLGNGTALFEHLIKGDTTINDVEYKKLHWRKFDLFDNQGCDFIDGPNPVTPPYSIIDSVYVAAIREDADRKVWLKPNNEPWTFCHFDTEEILLFDFNLEVGDTSFICGSDEEFQGYDIQLEQIEMLNYFGARRVFQFANLGGWDNYILYEGIGTRIGLRDHWSLVIIVDDGYYNLRDVCIGTDQECLLTAPLSVNNIIDNLIEIYPVPSTGDFIVSTSVDDLIGKSEIRVHSIFGQEILRTDLNNSSTPVSLDVESGLYMVSIYLKDQIRGVEKVLIVKE